MRRLYVIVAVAVCLLGGAGLAGATNQHATIQNATSQDACATPVASPGATPEVSPPASGSTPMAAATPDQSGRYAILSACSTPTTGTPAP